MSSWCVVNARPHQEERAEHNLLKQGFRAWLPVMMRSRRHARRIETVRTPVFPGYLFVDLDLERDAWGRINNTFGVRRLLTDNACPQVLPDGFVAALRESIGTDGLCTPAADGLKAGTTVRIVSGPFVDCLATVTALAPGDRVRLLLNVLGGHVSTTISDRCVTRVA